ncbi:hypothetical protein ZOD2009_14436 [Haladaptatus paucihalophilus DX253]|uniref:Uncharacterized protein n=1 Tax=Haladaptatus paucihalophilus DX253 TaxID=797209 RepID=E7QVQ1_HALPU|nr:hypothetical protein ZOD2009_14436 [Haladaptatus paucihalophilus DX253]
MEALRSAIPSGVGRWKYMARFERPTDIEGGG